MSGPEQQGRHIDEATASEGLSESEAEIVRAELESNYESLMAEIKALEDAKWVSQNETMRMGPFCASC